MKILLMIPTLKQGGSERVMSELANKFNILGHEVHICLLLNCDDFYKVNKGIIIHRLGFENKNRLQKIVSELNTFVKLRKLMVQEKPDVVLSFMEKFNVLTILSGIFLKHKVFISDRSNPRKKISPLLFYLKKKTYRYATGIIAQTSLAKEILLQTTKHPNIKVIANPIKKIRLDSTIARENIILNVGRMVPEKGQKYLIEAFSKLDNVDWKLVILGDGILREQLENQVKSLDCGNRIIMPGAVTDIDKWLARASIFAFPSVSEGFPNALVEAMAAGLPCVSFDCDAGPKDIIVNGLNGYLIETGNVNALKEALEKLCVDSYLRSKIGNEARNIVETLDAKLISMEYLDFFEKTN